MNQHQQHLLNLLKELNDFCVRHDITYYCAGGTVIGAARHRGFIPWDDDIDIYMTRSEFCKFSETLKKYPQENRILEYYEDNHEAQTAIPRYHADETTMFCHYNLFGNASAGTCLDVFILDPIPDDYSDRIKYLTKLYSYSDLISPVLTYSHRLPQEKIGEYEKTIELAKDVGCSKAVEMISEEIFRYEESECSDYCLRWGSIPLIYPIEVIGEPSYLQFEDMKIPVPHDWYQYLVIHYGMEWMNVPYEETQKEHINIIRYDMKYDYFYKKRDSVFSQEYLRDLHFQWKDSVIEFQKQTYSIEAFLVDTQNAICRATIDKRISESSEKDLDRLLSKGKYQEIIDVYGSYINLQFSNAYMGQRMRLGSQLRWFFPHIIPLSEKELEALTYSLFQTRKERVAEKLVGIYDRANKKTIATSKASRIIEIINDALKSYYSGDISRSMEKVTSYVDWESIPILNDIVYLCEARTEISIDREKKLKSAVDGKTASELQKKAWGDVLWRKKKYQDATSVYKDLMTDCRNGLLWMDIIDKNIDIPPIPTQLSTPFRETEYTAKQRQLIEEIAEICEKNNIKYIISPDLGNRMVNCGNIGYIAGNKEVLMDAVNATKFREAFKQEKKLNRNLLSWAEGDAINDFSMIYTDSKSVFCDFRQLEKWNNIGIYITIRILRREKTPDYYKKLIIRSESIANLLSLSKRDQKTLKTNRKKVAYHVLNAMPSNIKLLLLKQLFNQSINAEKKIDNGDLYYYSNTKGKRPRKHILKEDMWRNVELFEMNGTTYRLLASVVKEKSISVADLSNIEPLQGNFIYKSMEMSWAEISPLIDEKRYLELNWDAYAKARKSFRKLDAKVQRCWKMVLKEGEELTLNEKAADIVKCYKNAIDKENIDTAAEAISDVDGTLKKYEEFDVPVYLEEGLRACYENYLDRTKQNEFKKKMISLWEKDKSEFYNNA